MPEKSAKSMSRREFARRAAVASALVSLPSASAVAVEIGSHHQQAAQTSNSPSSPAALPPLPPNMSKLSAEGQAEADLRYQTIVAKYGSRFSDEQKADLRRLCVAAQPSLDRLRAFNIENSDGPGLYLKPLFEREKRPKAAAVPSAVGGSKTSGAGTKP